MSMNIPKALADLLNKTDPGWVVFAFMVPTRVFRITAKDDFCTFRIERFKRTNRDNLNPQGSWGTISTHSNQPLKLIYETALRTQKDFVDKMHRKKARTDAEMARIYQKVATK